MRERGCRECNGKDIWKSMTCESGKSVTGWIFALFWLCCFAGFLCLQSSKGAWNSDLGGDPDEAAHAVTSLMVRDYVTQSFGSHPLKFAEAYYARYPKIALGHYPPAYYLLSAVGLLPKPSILPFFILQAGLAASVATLMAWVGTKFLSVALSFVAGAAWCFTMPVLKLSMVVMADFFLVLTCLAAAVAFAFYLQTSRARWSLAFGVLASLAILIKGSGWMLAMLPPVAIALSRDWRLLTAPSLWLAPLPVLLLALPWQWVSFRISAEGMNGLTPPEHLMAAIPFYGEAFLRHYGWLVALVMVGALARLSWNWARGAKIEVMESVLWALLVSALVILMLVPAGLTSRYFLPLSAPLLLLTLLGMQRVAEWMRLPQRLKTGVVALAIVLSAGSLVSMPVLNKEVTGFGEAVLMIVKELPTQTAQSEDAILICSDPRGEGAMVAAAAFDDEVRAREGFRVVRASKILAEIDWLGRGNDKRFSSEQELLAHLKMEKIGWVLVDQSLEEERRLTYYSQLSTVMTAAAAEWNLWREVPVSRSENEGGLVQIYRRTLNN
jgi:hypothetical protein